MVEKPYNNAQLAEIIREALARAPGRPSYRKLADGFDLATAWYALRHSRAEASPETDSSLKAEALTILRAAVAPTGPFTTIPKLGRNFHIRMGRDGGMEVITDNGAILVGREILVQLRVDLLQERIDQLDRDACASLAANGKPLMKKLRADFIRGRLAKENFHLEQRTIENKIKAMPR